MESIFHQILAELGAARCRNCDGNGWVDVSDIDPFGEVQCPQCEGTGYMADKIPFWIIKKEIKGHEL